jgi:hypothetical protein
LTAPQQLSRDQKLARLRRVLLFAELGVGQAPGMTSGISLLHQHQEPIPHYKAPLSPIPAASPYYKPPMARLPRPSLYNSRLSSLRLPLYNGRQPRRRPSGRAKAAWHICRASHLDRAFRAGPNLRSVSADLHRCLAAGNIRATLTTSVRYQPQ